jgi:hypothetical protein
VTVGSITSSRQQVPGAARNSSQDSLNAQKHEQKLRAPRSMLLEQALGVTIGLGYHLWDTIRKHQL